MKTIKLREFSLTEKLLYWLNEKERLSQRIKYELYKHGEIPLKLKQNFHFAVQRIEQINNEIIGSKKEG